LWFFLSSHHLACSYIFRMILLCQLIIDLLCREPNPDMFILLRSPEGKLAERRNQSNSRVSESLVSLLATNTGVDAATECSEAADYTTAARCRPYHREDKASKYQASSAKITSLVRFVTEAFVSCNCGPCRWY
jgi:hypothetical protein